MADASQVIVDYARRQLASWPPGETRDVQREMMELTLQVACKMFFGAEVAADLAVVREAMLTVGDHFLSRLTSLLFLLPDSVPTPGNLRYRRAIQRLDSLVYRIIRERNGQGHDLLSMLQALITLRPRFGIKMTARARDRRHNPLRNGCVKHACECSW